MGTAGYPLNWTTEECEEIARLCKAKIIEHNVTFGISVLTLKWDDSPMLFTAISKGVNTRGPFRVEPKKAAKDLLEEKMRAAKAKPHWKNPFGMGKDAMIRQALLDELYPEEMGNFDYPAIIDAMPYMVSGLDDDAKPEPIDLRELSDKCKGWAFERGYITRYDYLGKNSLLTLKPRDARDQTSIPVFRGDFEPRMMFDALEWLIDNTDAAKHLRYYGEDQA